MNWYAKQGGRRMPHLSSLKHRHITASFILYINVLRVYTADYIQ